MAELDHTTIEQAIESLLEADATLYNASSTDGTKLIHIEEGIPLTSDTMGQLTPAAFITLDSEGIRYTGDVVSNAATSTEHEIRYRIRIIVADVGSKESEDLLNDFQKQILDIIEDNNKLSNNVDSCRPESIRRVQEIRNHPVFARDIIIKCIKTVS